MRRPLAFRWKSNQTKIMVLRWTLVNSLKEVGVLGKVDFLWTNIHLCLWSFVKPFLRCCFSTLKVWQPHTGTICGKAEEVAWWMESLGSFPRVLNVLPREKIEGPPRDFLKGNPRPHPRPRPRVFCLWSGRGCGQGFAFIKFQRGPSIFFRGSTSSTQRASQGLQSLWYLRGFPTDYHSFYLSHFYITWNVKNKQTNYFQMEP